jgi:hypothetical protein
MKKKNLAVQSSLSSKRKKCGPPAKKMLGRAGKQRATQLRGGGRTINLTSQILPAALSPIVKEIVNRC